MNFKYIFFLLSLLPFCASDASPPDTAPSPFLAATPASRGGTPLRSPTPSSRSLKAKPSSGQSSRPAERMFDLEATAKLAPVAVPALKSAAAVEQASRLERGLVPTSGLPAQSANGVEEKGVAGRKIRRRTEVEKSVRIKTPSLVDGISKEDNLRNEQKYVQDLLVAFRRIGKDK
jgi:hypothetical protein